MSVLGANNPTLLDLAKRSDPDGKVSSTIVEILNQTNQVLEDMTYVEGNLPTGHRSTIRTGIPDPTWRRMYQGVQPTKSTTAQVTDNCGMLEAYNEIDKALADLNGNTSAFRLSESLPTLEGIAQEIARTVFYGNEAVNDAAFTGLTPRFNDSTAGNGDSIIKAGGTGDDNRSIWLVGWSPNTVHGIVPKGSKAGVQMNDKGQVTIENVDGNGGRMEAYRTHYRFDGGLTVRDWRYIIRIANIDVSNLNIDPITNTSSANLPDLMFQAIERVPNLSGARFAWYASRDIWTMLRRQSANAVKNSTLTVEDIGGVMRTTFSGIPLKRVDVLNVDEALVA